MADALMHYSAIVHVRATLLVCTMATDGGNTMLGKVFIVAAFAAAGFLIPAGANAGGRVYGDHWRGDHWRGDRGYHRGWEHRGRYWHGRWWAYGEGRCWRRTPVGWVWICD